MDEKITTMQQGGKKLAKVRDSVITAAIAGVKTSELDRLAEELIIKAGGKPSFKMVEGYEWTTCICVNECIVHGVPNSYELKDGDTVTVDVGMFYQGFHTDTASTRVVGAEVTGDLFLETGKKALDKAIAQATAGNRIGHISRAMQEVVEGASYNVARTLVGHGIGKSLHEKPQIPCLLEGETAQTPELKEGMTIAVEVIYMQGSPELELDRNDRWTIRTRDSSRSAMFEHTIAITSNKPLILTK